MFIDGRLMTLFSTKYIHFLATAVEKGPNATTMHRKLAGTSEKFKSLRFELKILADDPSAVGPAD